MKSLLIKIILNRASPRPSRSLYPFFFVSVAKSTIMSLYKLKLMFHSWDISLIKAEIWDIHVYTVHGMKYMYNHVTLVIIWKLYIALIWVVDFQIKPMQAFFFITSFCCILDWVSLWVFFKAVHDLEVWQTNKNLKIRSCVSLLCRFALVKMGMLEFVMNTLLQRVLLLLPCAITFLKTCKL